MTTQPISYYVQGCPVCGRPLEIRVTYLGRRVTCQHCGGRFTASDPAHGHGPATDREGSLLDRAERLLRLPVRHCLDPVYAGAQSAAWC